MEMKMEVEMEVGMGIEALHSPLSSGSGAAIESNVFTS